MNLKDFNKCDRCKKIYDNSPFACMCGDGERSTTEVEIYGVSYDLCPSCTYELSLFLKNHNQNP